MPQRILIVDDHAIVRKMLKALVETHEGWQVCCEAENGLEAIAKVSEYNPDLIVMDMAMPVKDGISASRHISSIAPSVPIVMHTLHYSPELALEAKKAGVRAIVPKADSGDELLTTIEAVLSSNQDKAKVEGQRPPATIEAQKQGEQNQGGENSDGRSNQGPVKTG
jgi:DNA-binding NarL/FixJ family response regulator